MPRVVHFEILAEDPERALKFYDAVFGWKNQKWEGPMDYWLLSTGKEDEPGIDGALIRKSDSPNPYGTNTIGVESVDDALKQIQENGGEIMQPKGAIPGVGYFSVFKDPEGNIFGLMESDESAK